MEKNFLTIGLLFVMCLVGGGVRGQKGLLKGMGGGSYLVSNFIENKGQLPDSILYACEYSGGFFYFLRDGFIVQQRESFHFAHGGHDGGDSERIVRGHNYRVFFDGVGGGVKIGGQKKVVTKYNYILGREDKSINASCEAFQSLVYENVYPFIDLRFFVHNNALKYDIIVRPGGDLEKVRLKYVGVEGLRVKKKGVFYETSLSKVEEKIPSAYVLDENWQKREVEVGYKLDGNYLSYKVVGEYDVSETLVIDPSLIFASFSGSFTDNWGFTATYGYDSSFYLGGIVYASGFNASMGAFQVNFGGGGRESSEYFNKSTPTDVVISKFSSNGETLLYATYLGGSGDDLPSSLIEDKQGNLLILGRTNSSWSFPLQNKVGWGNLGGYDIFVTKLNTSGSGVIKSWVIGGSNDDGINMFRNYNSQAQEGTNRFYSDMIRSEINLDEEGNIYVASQTMSSNFPTKNAFQSVFGGIQDGVFIKIDAGMGTLLCSSFIGGSNVDAAFVVTINKKTKDIFIGGNTMSSNLPGDKSNTIKSVLENNDGFVSKISNVDYRLLKTTYIGTASKDFVYGLSTDKKGFVYVMGVTEGDWTTINAPYNTGYGKQYFGKMDDNLSRWVYTTKFGTNALNPNIAPVAFMVDKCERVYIGGFGQVELFENASSNDFKVSGTTGLPITSDALQKQTDNGDFYFIVFEKDATKILYSTFYGVLSVDRVGENEYGDHVDGGTSRFDENGVIYQAICAACNETQRYPTTANAAFTTKPSGASCNMLGVKIDFELSGVVSKVYSMFLGKKNKALVCKGVSVFFGDEVGTGEKYYWLFGDGTPEVMTTVRNVEHVFNENGTYNVRLVSFLSTSCNVFDTSYIRVVVDDKFINLNFEFERDLSNCNELIVKFKNTSSSLEVGVENATFVWDFGDGETLTSRDLNVVHVYKNVGTYVVTLSALDVYCNRNIELKKTINVVGNIKASFDVRDKVCYNVPVVIMNTSSAATVYEWYVNGVFVTKGFDFSYTFNQLGVNEVKLVVRDDLSCNKISEYVKSIEVKDEVPKANFDIEFKPTEKDNQIPFFINKSERGLKYVWRFGDNTSLTTTNKDTAFYHFYNESKRYEACLIVVGVNCEVSLCKPIDMVVNATIIAPNAFTPNRDGVNDVFYVKSIGVKIGQLKIINRWGQIVFETDDLKKGWDGTYLGIVQMPDVYTYIVDYEDYEGRRMSTKGLLSLIQ